MKSFTPSKSPVKFQRPSEGLRLLGTKEAAEDLKERKEAEVIRAAELDALIKAKHQELRKADEDFKNTIAAHRFQWTQVEAEHRNRLQALLSQTELLERRREQALIPLTIKESELDNKDGALTKREEIIRKREEELEAQGLNLQARLDAISEREGHVDGLLALQTVREEGIQHQAEQIKINSDRLTKAITDSKATMQKQLEALALREAHVASLENGYALREEQLKQRELDVQTLEVLYRNYPFESPIIHGTQ